MTQPLLSVKLQLSQCLQQNSWGTSKAHLGTPHRAGTPNTHSSKLQTLHLCCRKCTATRLLSRTLPASLHASQAQLRIGHTNIYIQIYIYTAASLVSVLLKGTNYIHGSKVITKCIRRDSTPLTDSSETRLGDKRAGGRATVRQEIPFPFLRGEQSSAVLF